MIYGNVATGENILKALSDIVSEIVSEYTNYTESMIEILDAICENLNQNDCKEAQAIIDFYTSSDEQMEVWAEEQKAELEEYHKSVKVG